MQQKFPFKVGYSAVVEARVGIVAKMNFKSSRKFFSSSASVSCCSNRAPKLMISATGAIRL